MKRLALPLIVTGIVIIAILLTVTKEGPTMSPSAIDEETASLPPIDLDAAVETETATFAMG